jgi:indolepyruvate ferredoxin oxidoreductase alpha subunit
MFRRFASREGNDTMSLLGNAAIARGAMEAGVQFVAAYPGTPSTEIVEALRSVGKELDIYVEWSVNEKVAMEVAASAAISGLRTLFAAKHVGLNVAADPMMTLSLSLGIVGGMVIVVADDPSCHSSQNEQDSRFMARMANMPCLEPADIEEAKDMTSHAFDISEQFGVPMMVRSTTRISHSKGNVTLEPILDEKREPNFQKDYKRWVCIPSNTRVNHERVINQRDQIREWLPGSGLNFIDNADAEKKEYGIVTSGISYSYIKEALDFLGVEVPILKFGMVWPIERKILSDFADMVDKIIVIEEVEPYLETIIAHELTILNKKNELLGKYRGEVTPRTLELNGLLVAKGLQTYLGGTLPPQPDHTIYESIIPHIPNRPPVLCAGCPHRNTFRAMRKAIGSKGIYNSDIGCYTLGDPNLTNTCLDMGGSIAMASGFGKLYTDRPVVAIIGDSTFFHSGMTGLVNAVYNKSRLLLTIVDNRITAMTGMQDNPGSGKTALGDAAPIIDIEGICKAVGANYVKTIDPFDLHAIEATFKEAIETLDDGVAVIVSRQACAMEERRIRRKEGIIKFYTIDADLCDGCGRCIRIGCPAIEPSEELNEKGKPKMIIDPEVCNACGLCVYECTRDAIQLVEIAK